MSLTLAKAVEKIKELERELAVWGEVEGYLLGFVKKEEQDSLKKVITTEPWKSKGFPPEALVVPQEVIGSVIRKVRSSELEPRREQIKQLQGLPVQENGEDDGGNGAKASKPTKGKEKSDKQGEQKSSGAGGAEPGGTKLRVAPKGPNPGKKARRLVPKSAGAGSV